MAQSTARGLLYTTPPSEDEERTENEPTRDRTATAQSGEANRGRAAADD
ncbi:hypothetical protein [Halococcus sp. AFM35]